MSSAFLAGTPYREANVRICSRAVSRSKKDDAWSWMPILGSSILGRGHLERGCLARPVRAMSPEELPLLDVEADAVHRRDVSVRLAQVADRDGNWHKRPRYDACRRKGEPCRRLADSARPAAGELVGAGRTAGLFARVGGQLSQRALDLLPHPAERDPEHALTALQQVDDLVGRRAGVHTRAIAHQRDLGQVAGTMLAQVGH